MCFSVESADDEAMDDQASGFNGAAPSGATILVVDDEDGVRGLIHRILTRAGFEVVMASSGPEAIALMEGYEGHVDLLLVDVIMPRMSGRSVAEQLGLPTVFMSGYPNRIDTGQGILPEDVAFLPKPFTRSDLLEAVSTALRDTAGSTKTF